MRTVEEIQRELSGATARLEGLLDELDLPSVVAELENYMPSSADFEVIGNGDEPPTVEMEVQGDLSEALEAATEAVEKLAKAAGHTKETVHADWMRRQAKLARSFVGARAE